MKDIKFVKNGEEYCFKRALSQYEEWKNIKGNENKTRDDYFNELALKGPTIDKLFCKDNKLYTSLTTGLEKEITGFSLVDAINENIEYGEFGFDSTTQQISTINTLIPLKSNIGNIELNTDGTVDLKANKTYKVSCYIESSETDSKKLIIKQNDTILFDVYNNSSKVTIIKPASNCNIGVYTSSDTTLIPILSNLDIKLIIQEIAQPVINNLNFDLENINSRTNIEDTPVGHIISFMGTKAPKHYLICDGSVYNINEYKELSEFIKDQFGSYNYFGGDGTTTFAVPDLRGEFLRGTGTATRNTGSGSNVGVHQEPTFLPNIAGKEEAILWTPTEDSPKSWCRNPDKNIQDSTYSRKGKYINRDGTWDASPNGATSYTTRPTNTSVLYCIKYEHTYCANITGISPEIDTTTINMDANIATEDTIRSVYNFKKGKYLVFIHETVNEQVSTTGFLQLGLHSNATIKRGMYTDGFFRSYVQNSGYTGVLGYCYLENDSDFYLEVSLANYLGSTKNVKAYGTIIKLI